MKHSINQFAAMLIHIYSTEPIGATFMIDRLLTPLMLRPEGPFTNMA